MNVTDIIDKHEPVALYSQVVKQANIISTNPKSGTFAAIPPCEPLYTRATVEKMLGEVFSEELRDVLFGNLWLLETSADVLYEAGYPGAHQGVLLLHQALSTLRDNCAAPSPAKEQG